MSTRTGWPSRAAAPAATRRSRPLPSATSSRPGSASSGSATWSCSRRDTHKFESRYHDRLVGPYPEAAALYRERSPSNFPDRISSPVLILQGLDDRVVPPSQAESIVAALSGKSIPYAYLAFEGEDHGFRGAFALRRTLEAGSRSSARSSASSRPTGTSHSRCPGSTPGSPATGRPRGGSVSGAARRPRSRARPAPARVRARLRVHEHRRRRPVPVHLRIGHRGPSGQDVRPGLRRHPGRDHPRGPERPRRLRDRDDDGPRHGPRRDLDDDLHRHPGRRPRHRPRHRLHPGRLRLRLPDLRHADLGQGAVARHRAGRRLRRSRSATTRRPRSSSGPATRG